MSAWLVITIIVGVVIFDIVLVVGLVRAGWGDLPSKFPAVPAAENGVTKNFQSFRIGLFNFGFAIHVTVDEQHLHLAPAKVLRWLGARPASIPWDRIALEKAGRRWSTVKIASHRIWGPSWCLDLAGEEAPTSD